MHTEVLQYSLPTYNKTYVHELAWKDFISASDAPARGCHSALPLSMRDEYIFPRAILSPGSWRGMSNFMDLIIIYDCMYDAMTMTITYFHAWAPSIFVA